MAPKPAEPAEPAAAAAARRFPLVCVCTGPGRCEPRGCDITAGVQAACKFDERLRWALSKRPRDEWPEHVRNPVSLGGRPGQSALGKGRTGRKPKKTVWSPLYPAGRGDCRWLGDVSYPCPLGDRSRDIHFCDCPELADDFGRCWGSPLPNAAKDVVSCAGCRHHDNGKSGPLEREMRQAVLRVVDAGRDPLPVFGGRGVIQCVGGSLYASLAFVSARVLRASGCTLPLEWWHLGRHEWDPAAQRLADAVGATVVDASAIAARLDPPPRRLWAAHGGWSLKSFAVLHTGLAEVLFLDADNVVARDPTFLFSDLRYLRRGAAFWVDPLPGSGRYEIPPRAWRAVGVPPWPELPPLESGQFMVDRRRHALALRLVWTLNDYSDFWYEGVVYGDKDLFAIGFDLEAQALQAPRPGYHFAPRPGYAYPSIRQPDFDGRLLFQHNISGKRAVLVGGLTDQFVLAEPLRAAAAELRSLWDGKLWACRDQDAEESALALAACGRWRLTVSGAEPAPLTLLPGGLVAPDGDGGGRVRRWSFRLFGGAPTLILIGPGHKDSEIVTAFLTPSRDGRWRGRREYRDRGPVVLEAET